jgi:hypothetical protein
MLVETSLSARRSAYNASVQAILTSSTLRSGKQETAGSLPPLAQPRQGLKEDETDSA